VGIVNPTTGAAPMKTGHRWGGNEAVELAFAEKPGTPPLILRGYADGHAESTDEGGASPAAVESVMEGVTYAARILNDREWSAEWRIPRGNVGLSEGGGDYVQAHFSLSVRKTPSSQWLMWVGTDSATWEARYAGLLRLE
jgi:hypothetical protein